jgi:hypothetical protein
LGVLPETINQSRAVCKQFLFRQYFEKISSCSREITQKAVEINSYSRGVTEKADFLLHAQQCFAKFYLNQLFWTLGHFWLSSETLVNSIIVNQGGISDKDPGGSYNITKILVIL